MLSDQQVFETMNCYKAVQASVADMDVRRFSGKKVSDHDEIEYQICLRMLRKMEQEIDAYYEQEADKRLHPK